MNFMFFCITLESPGWKMYWGAAQQEATRTDKASGSEEAAGTTETEEAAGT